jgi:lipopolysaccharide export system permease protein
MDPARVETEQEAAAVRVLYRYLVREMLLYFTMVLILVLVLFVAIDYLGRMGHFIEAGITLLRALQFVLLKVPFMVVIFIPVGVLLSVLIAVGLMARNNELVALKGGGVSIYGLFRPVLGLCAVAAVAMFFLSEAVTPITMDRANRIEREEIKKRAVVSAGNDIWVKRDRMILFIRYYEPLKNTVHGVSINFFDDAFNIVRRLDARAGVIREGQWVLSDALEQRRNPRGEELQVRMRPTLVLDLDVSPDELRQVAKKSDEMGFWELLHYVRKIEAEGYDATAYRVDLHAKVAFPFVCLIMGLVGLGIAAGRFTGKSLSGAIALGIGTAFAYWILHSFCISLGKGEILAPVVAAWAANFVFVCLGGVLVQSAV